MKYGYARVSTTAQNPQRQEDELRKNGAENVIVEFASGANKKRPLLDQLLNRLLPNDDIIVLSIDRLARSILDFLKIVERIEKAQANLIILDLSVDGKTASGRLVLNMLMVLAEFERKLIVERTLSGLQAAKARGIKLGAPNKLNKEQKVAALEFLKNGKSQNQVARIFKVHASTICRLLKKKT